MVHSSKLLHKIEPLTHNCENDTSEKKVDQNDEFSEAGDVDKLKVLGEFRFLIMCRVRAVGNRRGKWRLTGKNMMIIGVYAPQEGKEKQALWDFLRFEVDKWNGDVIIMGDFNEVNGAKGGQSLHSFRRHPRGGLELTQVEELAKVINPVVLTQSPDSWSLDKYEQYWWLYRGFVKKHDNTAITSERVSKRLGGFDIFPTK
ncbi:RNA-directed DNA polymerase, eukaryota [Tanacetum coccineum]